jgi:hypothetical protein
MWEGYYSLELVFEKGLVDKTEVQVKDLNHMFCLWISFHKLCKQHVFLCVGKIIVYANLGWIKKYLYRNCKVNEISFWLFIPSTIFPLISTCLHAQVSRS